MTFLQPAGLWLLGLIPVILLIHLLRSRPRRETVPSAFLWRGLDREVSASRRVRPSRPTLLLLLQLLFVAAIALAVAGPRVTAPPRRHLFVLLDASASMLAREGVATASRFDEAARQARLLLDDLGAQDRATVLRVGPRPKVLAEDVEPAEARAALDGAHAGAGSAQMRDALLLLSDLGRRVADAAPEAVVLTDGAFADPGDLGALGLPVRFQLVGRPGANQAVAALQVQHQPRPGAGLAALARVVNYADTPARLPLRLLADDVPLETREVEVAARGGLEVAFTVPEGARRVTVALGARDPLPEDDLAEVAVEASQARQVSLVSRMPETLERALRSIPNLRVETISPEGYTGAGAELVVLDGFLPERLPGGQLLIVNPPSGRPGLPIVGEARSVEVSDWDARHPLLRSVDLSAVRLVRASTLDPPSWARVVAETAGGPLILEGQEDGRSIVVLGFDPVNSGVDRMLAFPLLVSNAVAFLSGGELAPSLPAGRSATLPVQPGVREVQLEGPEGAVRTLPVTGASVRLDGLELPGRYLARERGEGAGAPRTFTINIADEAESDIRPRQPAVLLATSPSAEQPSVTPTEIWPALLSLGLAALGAEWWRFGRRG